MKQATALAGELCGTESWASHPRLLAGESLNSWAARQAEANFIGYRSFLGAYLGGAEWRRRDLDLADEHTISILAGGGRVRGGSLALARGTLGRWMSLVGPTCQANRKSWLSSIQAARYCVECLAGDTIRHFRLLWRLRTAPVCPQHLSLLNSSCPRCRTAHSVSQLLGPNGSECRGCNSRLDVAPVRRPQGVERLFRFVQSQERTLDSGRIPGSFGWHGTAREFFDVLQFLVHVVGAKLRYKARLSELLDVHGLQYDGAVDWRESESLACVLLDESLSMIEDWPKNASRFLEQSSALVNEVAIQYGRDLPSPLGLFRHHRRGNFRADDLPRVGLHSDREALVKTAVDALIEDDRQVGPVSVGRMTGIAYETLVGHSELLSIVRQGQRELMRRRIVMVKGAADSLRAQGRTSPSMRAIAACIGRSTWYLRNSPELTRLAAEYGK